MKRILLACALAAGTWCPPPALHAAEIALRGAPSCALWTKSRAKDDASYEKAWLAGYFSGLAIGFDVDFWGTKAGDVLDNEQVWQRMDEYCAADAQGSLLKPAEKLFLERMHRAGK